MQDFDVFSCFKLNNEDQKTKNQAEF